MVAGDSVPSVGGKLIGGSVVLVVGDTVRTDVGELVGGGGDGVGDTVSGDVGELVGGSGVVVGDPVCGSVGELVGGGGDGMTVGKGVGELVIGGSSDSMHSAVSWSARISPLARQQNSWSTSLFL